MTATIYNISLLAGLALVGAGVDMMAGVPVALVTVGSLVIGLTLFSAAMGRKG